MQFFVLNFSDSSKLLMILAESLLYPLGNWTLKNRAVSENAKDITFRCS